MCKSFNLRAATDVPPQPYTGATVQLRSEAARSVEGQRRQRCRSSFPWWTLWLIWPLIGVAKMALPMLLNAGIVISQIGVPLLIPLALIVIGVLLLRRS